MAEKTDHISVAFPPKTNPHAGILKPRSSHDARPPVPCQNAGTDG